MRKLGMCAILAGGAAVLIFTAGFFHAGKEFVVCTPAAACGATPADAPSSLEFGTETHALDPAGSKKGLRPPGAKGLLALTIAPGYKRAGDLSLRVADCTKAEDDLEMRLETVRGEILDMVMEGTEGSRTCSLSVIIPADRFRGFIAELRTMGKVQAERITASKLKPGQDDGGTAGGDPDPRELSLVSIRMADEKVARTVLESRGILATSFDRSASHFMKGIAVIVELFGLALPFLLTFGGLALPVLAGMRLRRARAAVVVRE